MACLQATAGDFFSGGYAQAHELSWFAVQTKSRHEKKATAEATEKRYRRIPAAAF